MHFDSDGYSIFYKCKCDHVCSVSATEKVIKKSTTNDQDLFPINAPEKQLNSAFQGQTLEPRIICSKLKTHSITGLDRIVKDPRMSRASGKGGGGGVAGGEVDQVGAKHEGAVRGDAPEERLRA